MNKLRVILAAAFALTAVFLLSACGGSNESTEDKGKVYVVATDTTFAPFEFENAQGEFVGIDMDLLAAIAEDQGFDYDVRVLGFNAAVQALEAKQVDAVIAGMSITEERKNKFDFSDPYFDSGVVMAVSEDNDAVQTYNDLAGERVAVKTGTEGADFANSIKDVYGFTVVTFDDSANLYEDVKAGNSVACFDDYPVLGYGISQGNGLKLVTEKEQGSSYGFAVNKGENAELLEAFNNGLAKLRENGKYQQILDTYISKS